MKKQNKFLMGILAMCIIVGCSDDHMIGDGAEDGAGNLKDAVYLSVSVSLPSKRAGTRSGTIPGGGSTEGTEIGKDKENAVKEILLVLTDGNHGFAACGLNTIDKDGLNSEFDATVSINRTQINSFYDEETNKLKSENQDGIYVYVFCNPTKELKGWVETAPPIGSKDWLDRACQVTSENRNNTSIWHPGTFLMSNYEKAKRKIPVDFTAWQQFYTSESQTFNLSGNNAASDINNAGAIKVERSVARFDFRDGSPVGENTYNIGTKQGEEDILKVKLYRMALVNMSNEFYYLRRVSDNGMFVGINAENYITNLCGWETKENYVVDTDAEFKSATIESSQLSDHFNYPFFNSSGGIDGNTRTAWDRYWIDDVLDSQKEDDNYESDNITYKIWRYVTENTIPGDVENQRNSISTGVVFKGKLVAGDKLETEYRNLADAIHGSYNNTNNDYVDEFGDKKYPILYRFGDEIFVGWSEVVEAANREDEFGNLENSKLNDAVFKPADGVEESANQRYETLKKDQTSNVSLSAFRKAATAAGFTLYQASDDANDALQGQPNAGIGYFFYYYYWNRHNDNEKSGAMGPMEFAVVRNNIYKLAVTKISGLGHPRLSANDPNPPVPETPNEDANVYITVDVEVLPWVVRVNNIDF